MRKATTIQRASKKDHDSLGMLIAQQRTMVQQMVFVMG